MAENKNGIIIGGFCFENEEEAAQAKKEAEGIRYLREKINMDTPEAVLGIYNKMIQQKLFETAVGYAYLKELQEYLRSIPFIDGEAVLPIPVSHPVLEESIQKKRRMERKAAPEPQMQVKNFDFRKRYQAALGICLVLFLCVVGMFTVSMFSNSPTILNYETKLIDRYEQWERELEEREAALAEREKEIEQD